jgi:hypothetical protein
MKGVYPMVKMVSKILRNKDQNYLFNNDNYFDRRVTTGWDILSDRKHDILSKVDQSSIFFIPIYKNTIWSRSSGGNLNRSKNMFKYIDAA